MMEKTPENVAWALRMLRRMSYLRGGPQTEEQQILAAQVFLRIVGPYEPQPYEIDPGPNPGPVFFTPRHYTTQETVDWLLEELLENNDGTFPSMSEIRRVYDVGKGEAWGDAKEKARRQK